MRVYIYEGESDILFYFVTAIANSTLDSTAYLDFSVSTCGRLSGVIITHRYVRSPQDQFHFSLLCNQNLVEYFQISFEFMCQFEISL